MSRTIEDLKMKQALPLDVKISLTRERIRQWVNEFGEDGVYVSFSGGKDSTVLLDIVRNVCGYTDIPAVFVDVPTQFSELREFATSFDNVEVLKPKISFVEVCKKYGFPLISKEISESVYEAKKSMMLGKNDTLRIRQLNGETDGRFDKSKWKFMLEASFNVSHMCCNALKKSPIKKMEKETGRKPILATMAEESQQRTSQWLANGCNGFKLLRPVSNPMSFWTEQDVLTYIVKNNIKICSVYGDVVEDFEEQLEGQMDLSDFGLYESQKKYKCTGCKRTGCMLCGFGCHLEKKEESRFLLLKQTHPKMYALLDVIKNNGVSFREAIEWTNEHMTGRGHIWI